MRFPIATLTVLAALSLQAPAFAKTTTVKVVEGGEGGGPMTLSIDRPTVKAGDIVFEVHNDAVGEVHEMVLVKLKTPDDVVAAVAANHRVDEKKLQSLGEVADLKPGSDGTLKARLKAGTYLLLCNIKGHYEAGMHARLVVTK